MTTKKRTPRGWGIVIPKNTGRPSLIRRKYVDVLMNDLEIKDADLKTAKFVSLAPRPQLPNEFGLSFELKNGLTVSLNDTSDIPEYYQQLKKLRQTQFSDGTKYMRLQMSEGDIYFDPQDVKDMISVIEDLKNHPQMLPAGFKLDFLESTTQYLN